MQQNAIVGRYRKAMGVQRIVVKIRCIVVKNPDASWVEIENIYACADQVCCLARSLQACSRGSNKEAR